MLGIGLGIGLGKRSILGLGKVNRMGLRIW